MTQRAVAMGLAVILLASACTATQSTQPSGSVPATSSASASPSVEPSPSMTVTPEPTATPVPTPTPPVSSDEAFSVLPAAAPAGYQPGTICDGEIGATDPVAVVQLVGAGVSLGPIVLRDYADPANPRTACTFVRDNVAQLIDARHVVINACNPDESACASAVLDLPELRYHWFAIPDLADGDASLEAISPSLDEVAWFSTGSDGTHRRVHLTRTDGDHEVAKLFPVIGRCGSPTDSVPAAYSRSGHHLLVLDVPNPGRSAAFLVFNGSELVLSFRSPADVPIMPVWSPIRDALYYAQGGDIWRWTQDGGARVFLRDLTWYYPTISPDGRYLAYSTPLADGTHDTYLLDLAAGGAPQLIGHRRTTPVFLTDTQLWYRSEGQGVCGPGVKDRLIYDVDDGSEAPSIIDYVYGTWPATNSQLR